VGKLFLQEGHEQGMSGSVVGDDGGVSAEDGDVADSKAVAIVSLIECGVSGTKMVSVGIQSESSRELVCSVPKGKSGSLKSSSP
jgi:hypothetical protein